EPARGRRTTYAGRRCASPSQNRRSIVARSPSAAFQRPVSRCKANPARDQGQVEQAERDAIPRCHLADLAERDVDRPGAVGRLGSLLEVENLSTNETDRQ